MESFIRNLGTNENYVNLNPKPYKKRKKRQRYRVGPSGPKETFIRKLEAKQQKCKPP
jgi:hypothetical protein